MTHLDPSLTAALIALIPASVATVTGTKISRKHQDNGLALTLGLLAATLLWVITLTITYLIIT